MRKFTAEDFIKKAKTVHGDKYDYREVVYIDNKTKVTIVCPHHGEFAQQPNNHIQGQGCPECGVKYNDNFRRMAEAGNVFIEKSKSTHNDYYDYSKVIYNGSHKKVVITCPIHGDFEQAPGGHLAGKGCPECAHRKRNNTKALKGFSTWSYSDWKHAGEVSNRFDSFKLYIIECTKDDESFIKIGKTFLSVGQRFRNNVMMPYEWKLVKEITGSAEFISSLEEELHRNMKNAGYSYTPSLSFDGSSECYKATYEEIKI